MNYSYRRLLSFFVQFIRPYWFRFTIGTVFSIIAYTTSLYGAYALAKIVDILTLYKTGESLYTVYAILLLWLTLTLVRLALAFTARYININVGERAAMDSELYSVKHLSLLDISWHEKENTGNKMRRIDRGARSLVDMTRMWTTHVMEFVVTFVGAMYILFQFDPLLVKFILAYQLIYYLIASAIRRRAVKAMHAANLKDEEVTGLWFEIVSNIRSVKVLGMASKVLEHAGSLTSDYLTKVKKRVFFFQGGGTLQGMWEGIVRIALMAYIVWGISEGQYQVGFLILFHGYFSSLTNAVSRFTEAAQEIDTAKASIGRLTDLLDEPVIIDSQEEKVDFPATWDSVEIKNVSFHYGENIVLSDLNFTIKKGEKIGIVGLSGAGKSTVFKLLLKEYESYEGDICIGGVSLKTIKKSSYVNHIAAVLQETEVFNMSLRKNIVLANSREELNEELFQRSLSIAHVNDFIPKLTDGVETLIGEKGIKLSGGEKQRLGIARAVFKKPEILFLDEATSHLDVESEQKIQDSLKKFFKDVTAVVIAHRLSTIREMDRIIVIEGGKVIESGTFAELNAQSGRFREFWDKQKM